MSQAPQKIGRYEILSQVGSGANGVVYRAQDPTIRRVVALKVMIAEKGAAGVVQTRSSAGLFEREAQAAGSLLHPNIVTLYDAGRDGDWYYLAMEFVEGGTLAAEISDRGRLPVARAIEVAAVVAEALDFAHERGVVHRDIKPANLMILPDQTVKVADFGIARLASAAATVAGDMVVGTPSYMSPEQVRGGKVDGRSDLFSLGVVLYETLTGERPFRGENLPAIMHAILHGTPPPPHEVEKSIPSGLSAVVSRAMQRDPARSYARGKDLAVDLRRCSPAYTPAKPRGKAGRGPFRKIAAAIAAGVLVAAGAGALLATRDAPPAPPSKPGWLRLVSDPPGADVMLDGKIVGRTPYTLEVVEGNHEIEFQKQGYYPAAQTARVQGGRRTEVELAMTARQEGQ